MTNEPRNERSLLTDYLSGRDVPCARCGFNLRNGTSERCGECGAPLAIGLSATRPRLGPFAVCAIGMGVPLGFSSALALPGWWRYFHYNAVPANWGRADWINLLASTGVSVVSLLLIWMMIMRSGQFLARRRISQWIQSFGWLLFGASLVVALIMTFGRMYSTEATLY